MLQVNDMGIEVRIPTTKEVVDIISEPRLLHLFPVTSLSELPRYVETCGHNWHLITFKRYSLVFYFSHKMHGVYEFHIACPAASIIACRILGLAMMKWMLNEGIEGIKGLLTTCPEGKIANMCRKLGGIEIRREEGLIHFMTTHAIMSSFFTEH